MALICKHVDRLVGYAPGEQPRFEGMIKLNTNENPYPPSPKVGAAIAAFDWESLRLYPDPLFHRVRQQIADMNGCSPEQIFVGNGSDEILALITRAFVEDGGTIGYLDPSYSLYRVLVEIRDAQMKPYPLKDDFTWQCPPSDWSDVFFLTNPNAPTSIQTSYEDVAAFRRAFQGLVVVDEAYADFAPFSCMALATDPANVNTLVMRTLSKSFSLAGIRFGYAVGPVHLIDAMYKIKDSYNMDALAQTIGLAALCDVPYMETNRDRILATRDDLAVALRADGWDVLDSAANFLFAKPNHKPATQLFQELQDKHIYVRYFPDAKTKDYLRITIGTQEQMASFLAACHASQ